MPNFHHNISDLFLKQHCHEKICLAFTPQSILKIIKTKSAKIELKQQSHPYCPGQVRTCLQTKATGWSGAAYQAEKKYLVALVNPMLKNKTTYNNTESIMSPPRWLEMQGNIQWCQIVFMRDLNLTAIQSSKSVRFHCATKCVLLTEYWTANQNLTECCILAQHHSEFPTDKNIMLTCQLLLL